ncbi:hypothetical protein ABK040_007464 [Willaertia magna]
MNKSITAIAPVAKKFANVLKTNKNVVFLYVNQSRSLHTQHKQPGFFDTISGCYTAEGYKLDFKPFEFRDGQPFWFANFLGGVIVAIPVGMAFFACFFSLFWYTVYDSQTNVFNSNPHPFLAIKNGSDMLKTINPLFRFANPYGPLAMDFKMLFYRELNAAKKHDL